MTTAAAIREARLALLAAILAGIIVQRCSSFLWYSPISKTQTLEDCLLMKESRSPFYPSYCDRLLRKYSFAPTTTPQPMESRTIGWGWTSWGSWAEDACPEVCGRRCRLRRRGCGGPYHVACKGKGRAYQFEDCPALEDEFGGDYDYDDDGDDGGDDVDGDTFQRTTEPSRRRNKDFLKRRQQQSSRFGDTGAMRLTRRRRKRKRKPRRGRSGGGGQAIE